MSEHSVKFGDRSLEAMCGDVVVDARTALAELVANSWDANASTVEIKLPADNDGVMVIEDDGCGMTTDEFTDRWGTFHYDRLSEQGPWASAIGAGNATRRAFGRNGVGRFGIFCFGDTVLMRTTRNEVRTDVLIERDEQKIASWEILGTSEAAGHGTRIEIPDAEQGLSELVLRQDLGNRFAADPSFRVFVNDEEVKFSEFAGEIITLQDEGRVFVSEIPEGSKGQNGVAWWVHGRLVGDVKWTGFWDGRRTESRRFLFVVEVDHLHDLVSSDWRSFKNDERYQDVYEQVRDIVVARLTRATKAIREERQAKVEQEISKTDVYRELSVGRRSLVGEFIERVLEKCPSIKDDDLVALTELLATMENSSSQYELIHHLRKWVPGDVDSFVDMLNEWTLHHALRTLDLIKDRLSILEELAVLMHDKRTLEVQHLQPLVLQALWVWGPEFESPEYTSNQSINTILKKFGFEPTSASLKRPDFVVRSDGSAALTVRKVNRFGSDHEVNGFDKLLFVELKRPGVTIDRTTKNQCLGYVDELRRQSFIDDRTAVHYFALGESVDSPAKLEEQNVTLLPMTFDHFLERGQARMFKLRSELEDAPFLGEKTLHEIIEDRGLARQGEVFAEDAS